MYRLGLTKLALEVFHFYRKNNMLSLVNQMSLKYVMLCAAEVKDSRTLHMAYNSQSASRQNSVILNCTHSAPLIPPATYIRCLLSLNDVKQATSLLSSFLDNPVYKRSNVSGGNDLYSNAIVGSSPVSPFPQASTKASFIRGASPCSIPSAPSPPRSPSPPSTSLPRGRPRKTGSSRSRRKSGNSSRTRSVIALL